MVSRTEAKMLRMMLKSLAIPVLAMPRLAKRSVVMAVDAMLCVLSVWLAFYLRLGEWLPLAGGPFWRPAFAIFGALAFALPVFILSGLYRAIFRYSGLLATITVVKASVVYAVMYGLVFTVFGVEGVPRTIGIIQPMLLVVFVVASRAAARYWLGGFYRNELKLAMRPKVLIYGAGATGRQLADALANSHEMRVAGFLDDDAQLIGQVLNGQPIFHPDTLADLVVSRGVSDVLLAMPSINRTRRNEILLKISQAKVAVRTLPSVNELAQGRVQTSDLRELDIDDLLGRDAVPPDQVLLGKNIKNKVVLVTGAGGSIGSELCRQILDVGPQTLLLVELSEFALYQIHGELSAKAQGKGVELIPLLASVQDARRVNELMGTWKPDTVYHAAAYKHVPLVEHNPAEGLKNNVLGTLTVAKAAADSGVKSFVLISTDKAVRPTNVMGASKRLAEMVLQAMAAGMPVTKFSMVRFGNVLGSSGSVVPKFRQQIKDGGPITLTHSEITRYFMTIPEAAQLVIQAGSMAEGGEVFVLDMGQPVKIIDLAKSMIELTGLTLKDASNPEGDIEIEITGLRPGEKLYEELLIGDDPKQTSHPRIMKANERFLDLSSLELRLAALSQALATNDVEQMLVLLQDLVTGYQREPSIVDWVHMQSHGAVA
ncbi:nucleoside-diphosphate sugar epimerase/dehydratase [Limnohabitans sp. Rim8]|uniref:nucleoside-diphosphate sugar epimerase/dehydratase n=1 Tax=Limnohabitans sp. Rim8 TaxID=1100718 RepID=UPI001E3E9564|nr:nucleoside-diphosphate sugar epimerase/dehydratase [Limnohabitans sp. Rim8]